MVESSPIGVENTVGKGEIAHYQQFLLFQVFSFDENGRKFSKTSKKHSGKRRNCSLRAISPFSTVFSKDLCLHKPGLVWERVLWNTLCLVLKNFLVLKETRLLIGKTKGFSQSEVVLLRNLEISLAQDLGYS